MHIPDGYLSPQTYIPMYAAMVPLWGVAVRRVNSTLRSRHVPLIAMGAAFSFVVMMFNIPLPAGTSGHAVGSALVAILLGPWAACVAVSLALVIQALLFGDGGITTLAANCFTMAVVMPFVGHFTYRLLAGNAPVTSRRRLFAGFIAGYLALNAAALYTAIMFGIQPVIATGGDGRPLYAPYPLAVAVPAMALGHLLLFGWIEGIVTALVIRYLQQADPQFLTVSGPAAGVREGTVRQFGYGVGVLCLLSPLGLVLPAVFNGTGAWGEWRAGDLARLVGFIPAGMQRLNGIWKAPIADYAFGGGAASYKAVADVFYLVSALLGVAAIACCVYLGGKLLVPREEK